MNAANWSTPDVFVENRYISPDTWRDREGKTFQPQIHYFVGGALHASAPAEPELAVATR